MVFRPIDLYVITSTFFIFFTFLQNPKKRDFLRLFTFFWRASYVFSNSGLNNHAIHRMFVKQSKQSVPNSLHKILINRIKFVFGFTSATEILTTVISKTRKSCIGRSPVRSIGLRA